MLLATDIGNSHIKFGVFDGQELIKKISIPTKRGASSGDIRAALADKLDQKIANAIVCSVVPDVEHALIEFLQNDFNIESIVVRNDFDFGLTINYEPLDALGTDRLVNALAAAEEYGVPCIVCSFGTATTIDVIDKDRALLGGIIAPGMKMAAKALHQSTAKLPEIEIRLPASILGNSTNDSILSGIVGGHIAMVEGFIEKIRSEIVADAKVVATGGRASMIAGEVSQIDIVDENLTLDGLHRLHAHL